MVNRFQSRPYLVHIQWLPIPTTKKYCEGSDTFKAQNPGTNDLNHNTFFTIKSTN